MRALTLSLPLLAACGDLIDPTLETVSVELDGEIVQTVEITLSGNNALTEPVDPASILVLTYNEAIDGQTAIDHVLLEDSVGELVEADVTLELFDVVVTPRAPLAGGNHVLRVEAGIDDLSGNTTETEVPVAFFVDDGA